MSKDKFIARWGHGDEVEGEMELKPEYEYPNKPKWLPMFIWRLIAPERIIHL